MVTWRARSSPPPLRSRSQEYARRPVATQTAHNFTVRERAVDIANRAGEKFIRFLDRYFGKRSLVGDHTFFAQSDFPWVKDLEAGFPVIRRELEEVLRYHDDLPNFQDISTDQYQITDDDKWKTFFLYGYGFRAEKNIDRCPETSRIMEQIPGMTTAMFSILSPHKHIPAHGGPYKGVLRCHLALIVPPPEGACRIRVGNDVRAWNEGKAMVFDDTWEHEAWNESDGTRVVLFIDFKRPLRGFARLLNEIVLKLIYYSPFVQDAKARHNAWEKRFEQIRNRAA
jgi:ornithine lipid ester-linked acyl 2-hydroxylase